MNPKVVETKGLTKTYGNLTAVDEINLSIEEGEIFGFLGPNGAGKTTTILMLLGLTEPTSGKATVYGYDPTVNPLKVKSLVGYLPERVGFYEDLTAWQNLSFTAELNRLSPKSARERIDRLLTWVGLGDVAHERVGKFSRGMKQRLGIADVLIKEPKLIILDEPTAGIDPQGANQILDLIADISRERKTTVVFSSHLLHHVQRICSSIAIMVKGRLVTQGKIEELGGGRGKYRIEVQVAQPSPELIPNLERVKGIINIEREGEMLFIRCDEDLRPQIAKAIVDSKSLLVQMRMMELSLEEIYMRHMRQS